MEDDSEEYMAGLEPIQEEGDEGNAQIPSLFMRVLI